MAARLLFVLFLAGCAGTPRKWDGKMWAGSPDVSGIERRQANELLRCDDPQFHKYVCMTNEDFVRSYLNIVSACESWKPGTVLAPLTEKPKTPSQSPSPESIK